MKRLVEICLLFLVLLGLAGCSNRSSSDGASGDTTQNTGDFGTAVHGASWSNPQAPGELGFHGDFVMEAGTESCTSCHYSDLRGDEDVPGCYDCHFTPTGGSAPVDQSWSHGSGSHADQLENGETCNGCHRSLREVGQGPDNCHDCHVSGSHPTGRAWLEPKSSQFHGNQADADLDACRACHGSSLGGGVADVSCDACHFGPGGNKSPVGIGWNHGALSHGNLEDSGDICLACHDLNRLFGNGPSACHDCHVEAMHATGQQWLDPKIEGFHGDAASADLASCASCHGSDYGGGTSGVGCDDCHFGPSGDKSPSGSNWAHGSTPHGNLANRNETCNACHTVDRLYGNGPDNCHDCHIEEDHPTGKTWLDVKSNQFHGDVASSDINSCAPCHGNDYRGGSSGVGCYDCHFGPNGSKVPPGMNWQHGSLPHQNLTPYDNVCQTCHSLDRRYGNGPAACHDCHAQVNHPTGAAWLDKARSGYHGAVAGADIESCKTCHGSNLQGGNSGVSCTACHFDSTGGKVPSGSSWQHGTTPHGNLSSGQAVCNSCHNVNRSYGHEPESCHDCHLSADHPVGRNWLSKGVFGFHGDIAKQSVDSCRQCHGQDYRGGSSDVSCYTCHFGPTGSKVPSGVSWQHGSVPHESLSPYIETCNNCHETNRSYGFAPTGCHDCHAIESHPLGDVWLNKTISGYHGDAANLDRDSCRQCHGQDYRGGSSGVSCYTCHFGPDGSRSPAGSSWVHANGDHEGLQSQESVCNSCHSINRGYGLSPESCHDCHGSGAAHDTGAVWLLPQNHAQQSIENRSACLNCHSMSGSGGSEPSCRSCHTASDPPLSTGNCTSCHGRPPNSGKHIKHISEGASCTHCHDSYGSGSANHWYPNPNSPADIRFRFTNSGDNMTATFDSQGNLQRCMNTCHAGSESENHGTNGRSW